MTLLVRLRDRADGHAWDEFMQIYEGAIYATSRQWGLQHADSCDLVQTVLQSVAKQVDTWESRHAIGSFRGWLRQVTRNHLINAVLARKRREHVSKTAAWDWNRVPDDANPDMSLFELEYQREVFHIAAKIVQTEFEPRTWEAFWMSAVDESPAHEIAKKLAISNGAVYIAKSRVMARLRDEVQRITKADEV